MAVLLTKKRKEKESYGCVLIMVKYGIRDTVEFIYQKGRNEWRCTMKSNN